MKKLMMQVTLSLTVVALAIVMAIPVRADDAAPVKPKQITAFVISADAAKGELSVKKVMETTKLFRTFKVDAAIKPTGGPATLGDLKAGDKVTVSYTEKDKVYTATAIQLEAKK